MNLRTAPSSSGALTETLPSLTETKRGKLLWAVQTAGWNRFPPPQPKDAGQACGASRLVVTGGEGLVGDRGLSSPSRLL